MSHIDAGRRAGHDCHAHPEHCRTDQLKSALMTIARELSLAAQSDPQMREVLHSAAAWLSEATAGHGAARDEHLRKPADDRNRPEISDDELSLIVERCLLKAEGCRWAVERDDMLQDGADFGSEVRPIDHDIIEQARGLPNCFLWMNQPRNDIRTRSDEYLLIADCFDALAEAVSTLEQALAEGVRDQLFMEVINLVAQAQSGLRVAVSAVETHPDTDQQAIYHWLRSRASEQRFYIARFMKVTDPADPEQCDELLERTKVLRARVAAEKTRLQQVEALLTQARGQVARAIAGNSDSAGAWTQLFHTIDKLVEAGLPAGSREFHELLFPVLDQLPADFDASPNMDQVIDALHLSVTALPDMEAREETPAPPAPPVMTSAEPVATSTRKPRRTRSGD